MKNEHLKNFRQRGFLAAFSELGCITKAAEAIRISRRSHYIWLTRDPDYAAAFEIAKEWAYDSLYDEAHRRAMGYQVPVYCRGKLVGTKKVYSDSLLIELLKQTMPYRYGDKVRRIRRPRKTAEPAVDLSKLTQEELIQLGKLFDKLGEHSGRTDKS